ncbi:vacuole membrane protein 1 isoform X1 [Diabrotica virgifera virgifera]|uniref:Vacuole membrane protein 1 isoform X1 n=2 Tax=Diabrotica virgifera virgifera TaxID=50390 RepID=A0A6P7G3X4_DIAVI|nr:vacuole membrane protein 1 isoform X1 [Diabrotica virgifera virgifera]
MPVKKNRKARPAFSTQNTKQTSTGNPPKNLKISDELLYLNKEQLKIECRKRGQKTTGTKNELLQRLGKTMAGHGKKKDATGSHHMNGGSTTQTKNKKHTDTQKKEKEKNERESLVLWRKPLRTVEYFIRECIELATIYGKKILASKVILGVISLSVLLLYILVNSKGPHQALVQGVYKQLLWCSYWVGLGILSSVGLGTGLHTFLLYLGPHIAQVTLAAYECGSLDFPEPPYPDEIVCPTDGKVGVISFLSIMSKVRLEAMCWGAGTALGELPPYFMARAARLSGIDPDDEDEDLKAFEELEKKKKHHRNELTLVEKGKLFVEDIVQKVGFLGILACASIPNPLFDLAGITCGHFLVPFWTFFGATLIGKAIIKMHLQKMFVIIAFNETLIDTALDWLKLVPVVGEKLQVPFKAFLNGQKQKLHKNAPVTTEGGNILGSIFEKFVIAMVLYFVISIVNSFAQSYHKRINKKKNTKASKD